MGEDSFYSRAKAPVAPPSPPADGAERTGRLMNFWIEFLSTVPHSVLEFSLP